MNTRLYPESRVELTSFGLKHYDTLLDIATLGFYQPFIKKAIQFINIQPEEISFVWNYIRLFKAKKI